MFTISSLRLAARISPLLAAAAAHAVVNTTITWQGSTNNSTWQSGTIHVATGQYVLVRALVTYSGTASPLGLASLVMQPTVASWDAAGTGAQIDTLAAFIDGGMGGNISTPVGVFTVAQANADPSLTGRFSPWGRSTLSSTAFIKGFYHNNPNGDGTNYLRIAQAQNVNWFGQPGNTTGGAGVPIAQLNNLGRTVNDPAFEPSLANIPIFRFGITPSSDVHTLVVSIPAVGFGNQNAGGDREVYWYADLNEVTGSIRGTAAVNDLTIIVENQAPGACCAVDGTCSSQLSTACPGQWFGPGTTCGTIVCLPAGPTVCCNPATGACVVTSNDVCQVLGSRATGAACSPNPCPVPTGACCHSAACAVSSQAACTGTWRGAGISCVSPVGSSVCCRADADASGTLAVQDVFFFLNDWFTGCH